MAVSLNAYALQSIVFPLIAEREALIILKNIINFLKLTNVKKKRLGKICNNKFYKIAIKIVFIFYYCPLKFYQQKK